MNRVTVSEDKSTFCRDKKPFFYLADTIWSAFTNITGDEWIYYLKRRKEQGFNVLQINTMPQWDRCISDIGLYPFATADGHRFDFTKLNEAYYEHAVRMCEQAKEEGFQLALVVLWLNYVPGTWGSKVMDCNVMPKEFVKTYTEKIVHVFNRFEPIYIVSGDTDFDTPEAVSYYRDALDVLCEKSPHTLKTMHIKRGYDFLPEEFLEKLDFYMFQSGHNREGQDMAYVLPENFRKKYPKKPLIKDLNSEVKAGQTVAIVGPTGAGKTTLINLLMRFYDVNEGAIKIDGIDTKKMERHDVRSLFGMVLQDAWLYEGTIGDNIRFGKLDATDYEVVDAAKTANVDHFIRTMPDGYEMIINSEGDNVSLGQKQLLTIARAVISDPKILILDEATSSVDTRLEALIQKAMDKVMEGRTSFVIAHRLSTIREADLILVMDQGSIIEKGNHETLLAAGGFYSQLYQSQFSEEAE